MYRTFAREPKYKASKREHYQKNEESREAFEPSNTSEEDEVSTEKDTEYESEDSGESQCTTRGNKSTEREREKDWEVGRRIYQHLHQPKQFIIKTCAGDPRIRKYDKITQKNLLSPFPSFLIPPIRREVTGAPNFRISNVKTSKEGEKHPEKSIPRKKSLKREFSHTQCKNDRKNRTHSYQHKDRYHGRQNNLERVLTCLHYDNMLKSNESPESFPRPSIPTAGISERRRENETGNEVECPKRTHEFETQGNSRRNLMTSCVKARDDEKPSNQREVKEKLVYVVEEAGKDATKMETDLFTLNEILAIKKDLLELSEFAKKLKKLKEAKKESDINRNKGNFCNCKPADELLKDVNKRIESLEARQEELEKGSNKCEEDSKKSPQTSSESQPKVPETSDRSAMTVFHEFPKEFPKGEGVLCNTEIINELMDIKTQLQKLEQKRMLKTFSDETVVKLNTKPVDKKDHGIAVFSSKTYILTPENFLTKNEENDKEKKKNDFFNVEDKTKSEMTNENVTNWLKNVSPEERKNEFPLFLATEQREQKNFGEIGPDFHHSNNAQILKENDFENQARRSLKKNVKESEINFSYLMKNESSAEGFTQRIEYKKCLMTPSGKVFAVINESREQFNSVVKELKKKPSLELDEDAPVKNNRTTTSSASVPSAIVAKEKVQGLKNPTVKRDSQSVSASITRSMQELSSTATKSEKTVRNMKLKNLEKRLLSNFLREKKHKENKNEIVKRLEAKLLALKKSLRKEDPSTTSYSYSEFIASIDLDSEKVAVDKHKLKTNPDGVAQYFTYMASTKQDKCDAEKIRCKQEEKERVKQLKAEIKREKRALKDFKKRSKEECKRKAKEAKQRRKCKAKKEKIERKERKKLEKLRRKQQQRRKDCCSSSTPISSTPPSTEESSPCETPPSPPPKPPQVIKSPIPCDIPTPYRARPQHTCKPTCKPTCQATCQAKLVVHSPKKHHLPTGHINESITLKKESPVEFESLQNPNYRSVSRDSLDIYRKKKFKKESTAEDGKPNVDSCLLKNFIKNVGRFYPKLNETHRAPLMSDYCTKKSRPKEKPVELKPEFTCEEDDNEEDESEAESAKNIMCTTHTDNRYKCPFHHRKNYHHRRPHHHHHHHNHCSSKPQHLRNCHCIKVYLQTQMGKEWPGAKPIQKYRESSTEVTGSKSSETSKRGRNYFRYSKPHNCYVGYSKVAYNEPIKSEEKEKNCPKPEQPKKETMSVCLCDKCGHIHCTIDKKPDKAVIEAQKTLLTDENICKENQLTATPPNKICGETFPFFSFLSHLRRAKPANSKSSKSILKKISEVRTIKTCPKIRPSGSSASKDKGKCNCMPKIHEIEERLGELEKKKQLVEHPEIKELKKCNSVDSSASLPPQDKKEKKNKKQKKSECVVSPENNSSHSCCGEKEKKKKKKKKKKCECGESPENNSSHSCCGEKEKKKKKKSKKKKPKKCCCTDSKVSNQAESCASVPEDEDKEKKKKKKKKKQKTCCDICCDSKLGLHGNDSKTPENKCEDEKDKKKKKSKKKKKQCDCDAEKEESTEHNCHDDEKKKKKKKKKKDKKSCDCCVKKEDDCSRIPETAAFYHTVQYSSKDDSFENTTLEENISFLASKENFSSKISKMRKKLSSAHLFWNNVRNGKILKNESDVENFLKQISYH